MCGKGCVCANEEPKDNRKRKLMPVRENEDVSCVRLGNQPIVNTNTCKTSTSQVKIY